MINEYTWYPIEIIKKNKLIKNVFLYPHDKTSRAKPMSVYISIFAIIPEKRNHELITIAKNVAKHIFAPSFKSPLADTIISFKIENGMHIKNIDTSSMKFMSKKPNMIKWALQYKPSPHPSTLVIGTIIAARTSKKKFTYHI